MTNSADWLHVSSALWETWQSALSGINPQASPSFDPSAAFSNFFKPWLASQPAPYSQADLSKWITQALAALAQSTGQGTTAGSGPESNDPSAAPFAALLAFLRAPLNFDAANFAGAGAIPEALQWQNFKPSDFFKLFDLPPLGINREWEVMWRDVQSALKTESEASAALGRLNAEIYTKASKQFLRAINARGASDGEITSVRELYDFWIDTAEAAYREKVMTEAYAKTFGRAVNASAARQKKLNILLDAWRELVNAPQRKEIDEIIETQHALAASLRELKNAACSEHSIEPLDARLEQLAEDVEQLRRAMQTQKAAAIPTPQAATAKPARQRKLTASADTVKNKRKSKTDDGPKRAKPPKLKRGAKGVDEFDIGHFN